jgi:hypothetical protein
VWKRDVLFVGLLLVGAGVLFSRFLGGDDSAGRTKAALHRNEEQGLADTVRQLNEEFHADWQLSGLTPSARADDLTIARRLSLALTGTIPSLEEIRLFESRSPQHRISWWVDHLLDDRRSADYLAERLARAYVGAENGPFLVYRRRRFVTWLSDSLYANIPYDQLVYRLIAGRGLWTSSPETNFITATVDRNNGGKRPDPVRLAGRTARAFLGVRIDCLQCHDDNLGNVKLGDPGAPRGGTQRDFHQLAAFYSDARISLLGVADEPRPYRYTLLDRDEEQVFPAAVPFRGDLLEQGTDHRDTLARWTTHLENRAFARAAVNRVWAILCGRPLAVPVDDIPLHGPLPPALETLAADFAAHGFDLRRLIHTIVATEVYQLDSRADGEVTPAHERHGCVFPLTRLRPEQVAGGLIQSASLTTIDARTHILFRLARYAQENEFVKRYGDTGSDEFEDRGGTVTQRLLLMNGRLVHEKTKENPIANAATKIALLAPSVEKAVEAAYLAVLTRRPSAEEKRHFVKKLEDAGPNRRTACVEDIYWVLLNSTEFSWNH